MDEEKTAGDQERRDHQDDEPGGPVVSRRWRRPIGVVFWRVVWAPSPIGSIHDPALRCHDIIDLWDALVVTAKRFTCPSSGRIVTHAQHRAAPSVRIL